MTKRKKPIPDFASEAEEREYWDSHDTTEHFDTAGAKRVSLPNLRPSSPLRAISLRLPESLIGDLKKIAAGKAVAYQALARMYLAERVEAERPRKKRNAG